MKIHIKIVVLWLLAASLVLPALAFAQETFFVSPTGDDSAEGSFRTPWRTMRVACTRLSPGDTLIVEDGDYLDEGTIQVRFNDPETGVFGALLGDENHRTRIRSRSGNSRIFGDFDIRGSFIIISGLEVVGNGESNPAGIGVFESMEIGIYNNIIHNHGGCGILMYQCDLVDISGNIVFDNANSNPLQHSGISIFQPVVRTLDGTIEEGVPISEQISDRIGVWIRNNVCFNNENLVPTSEGIITDGNGIIADDYLYTQTSESLMAAVAGIGSPFGFAGTPMIDVDEDGELISYARRTLINRNIAFQNGGRGIHSFLATKITIAQNTCSANLQSQALQDSMFRNDDGELSFLNGEISLSESDNCLVVLNRGISFEAEKAAASDVFFNFAPEDGMSTNLWRRNTFINTADPADTVSVFGAESTLLLEAP